MVRDHRKIAKKYIMSGWFFIDFAATFPVNYVTPEGNNVLWSRLFRLFRLPKLIKILDLSRFNRVLLISLMLILIVVKILLR